MAPVTLTPKGGVTGAFLRGLLVQEEFRNVDVLAIGCGRDAKAGWLVVWVALAAQPVGAVACFLLSQLEDSTGALVFVCGAVADTVFKGDLSSSGLICPLLCSGLRRVALGVASFFQVRNGFITQGLSCTSKRWQHNAKLVGRGFNFLRQAGNKRRCSRINLALRLGR